MQGEQAKHRQRQQSKYDRQADQHIRMLKRGLELKPGSGNHNPERGIGERHALNVDKRQQQGATGG
ncbi:hypothetical protein D3C80_1000250 [compost metagenome]